MPSHPHPPTHPHHPPTPSCSNLVVLDEVMQHLDGEGCLRVAQLLKQAREVGASGVLRNPMWRVGMPSLRPPAPTPLSHPNPTQPPHTHTFTAQCLQLPYDSVLVVAQAHSLLTQAVDATDVVVKAGGRSIVEQGSTTAVS